MPAGAAQPAEAVVNVPQSCIPSNEDQPDPQSTALFSCSSVFPLSFGMEQFSKNGEKWRFHSFLLRVCWMEEIDWLLWRAA